MKQIENDALIIIESIAGAVLILLLAIPLVVMVMTF